MIKYYENGDILVKYRDTNVDDLVICKEVIEGDAYNTKRFFPLLEQTRANDDPFVILDMGANIGTFSCLANDSFPNANIHAYEMHPLNIPILKDNTESFATVHHTCITDLDYYSHKAISIADAFYTGHSGGSYVKPENAEGNTSVYSEAKIECDTSSLDSILEEFESVDLIKMDIEAQELVILPTAQDLHKVKCIIAECHDVNWFNAIRHTIPVSFITELHISNQNPEMGYFYLWNTLHGQRTRSTLASKVMK